MANASRDENFVPTLLAASSADGATPVKVWADPSTHRLLVDLGAGVVGPGTSTDNAIARWDGTTGETIQNSLVIIGDTGAVSGITTLTTSGLITGSGFKAGSTAGVSGSFTTADLKTVTVVNGIITAIV